MASRFWVGGTGTWDASDTTHWASSSGGAGGASVPGSSDSATFDASSGGGTVTVNHASLTIQALTMSAFTGTLDFATNDNNITLTASSGFTSSGSGTRTLNMGDGTWTLSDAQAAWSCGGATNFTLNANGSTLLFSSAAPTNRTFTPHTGAVFNVVSLGDASSSSGGTNIAAAFTAATLNIGYGNYLRCTSGITVTVTNAMTWNGTAAKPIGIASRDTSAAITFSSASNLTCTYCSFYRVTLSGGGSGTATNSFDLGQNSGITITPPGGAYVIGG